MAIEVQISASPSGGLRVIKDIPALRPCRLEGRNGIGKTMAVRLLTLASGQQPYSDDPASWKSLRALVGGATIRVSGLSGPVSVAELALTPAEWPAEVPLEIGDWLGLLTVDGDQRPASELFERLDVVHLSGTERLGTTIDRRQGSYEVALRETVKRLRALNDQRIELGEMSERVAFLTPAHETKDRERRDVSEQRLRVLDEECEQLRTCVTDLQRASTLQMQIDAGGDGDHEAKVSELRGQRAETEKLLKQAQAEVNAAVKALGEGSSVQKAIAAQERKLTKVRKRQASTRSRRVELSSALGLRDVADCLKNILPDDLVQLVRDALAETATELRDLEREHYRREMSSTQRAIHDELRVVLDQAIAAGQTEFIVGRLDEVDLTIGDLGRALSSPPVVEDGAGSTDLAEMRERQASMQELVDLDERAHRDEQEKTEILKKIEELRKEAPHRDAVQLRVDRARAKQQTLSATLEEQSRRLGSLLAGRLDGVGIHEAETERDELLAHQKVDVSGVSEALADAIGVLSVRTGEVSALRETVTDLDAAEARRRVARRTLSAQLRGDPKLSWAAHAAGLDPAGGTTTEIDWQRLSDRLTTLRRTVDALVNDTGGLESVASSGPGAMQGRYGEAIRAHLEAEAVADFSDPSILSALFDDGRITHFDLGDATVTWETAEGEARTRPLTAFSSGEGALGFIRARLRQIAANADENRLVFLDEFGAFIAADVRRPLAELLTGDEMGTLASQVIVMLPLQVDYATEMAQTTGALHERYADRVAQLRDHDYFVEEFSP
jgi:hypothetical protein